MQGRLPPFPRSRIDSIGSCNTTSSQIPTLPTPKLPVGALYSHLPPQIWPNAPGHPREDLAERLSKDLGLNIDESDGEGSGWEPERK